jgi:hypothetical protein
MLLVCVIILASILTFQHALRWSFSMYFRNDKFIASFRGMQKQQLFIV